jgi:MSHA biogenesis protein MshL
MLRLTRLISIVLAITAVSWAAPSVVGLAPKKPTNAQRAINTKLARPVTTFDFPGGDLVGTLSAVSRAMEVPIIIEDDVKGKIMFEIGGLTLRQLLTAACSANDVFFYIHPDGYVVVRSRIARIYPVDFLAVQRNVTSSNTVSMSTSGVGTSTGNGYNTGASQTVLGGEGGESGLNGSSGGSHVQVSGQNKDKFWDEFEAHIRSIGSKHPGDTIELSRTAGVLYIDGGRGTHGAIEAYWRSVMSRVSRGATVKVYVLDVEYGDATQLGVDLNVKEFRVGGIFDRNVRVGGLSTNLNSIDEVGGVTLGVPTFEGTIGAGKVDLFISALKTKNKVSAFTAPTIGLLNNRTSVVQVSNDMNFFSRTEDTTINDGSASGGTIGNGTSLTPVTRRKYTIQQFNFGLFLPVTVQISDAGIITLDLNPSLTAFAGVDRSQDGLLTAPQKQTHQFSTQVQLRDGEAYVMGGYKHSKDATSTRETPGLSSIPVLGRMFRNEGKTQSQGELMIVVEAHLHEIPQPQPLEVYTPNPARFVTADMFSDDDYAPPEAPAAAPIVPATQLQDAVKATESGKSVLIDLGTGL